MGVLSRFKDIMAANINALLDKAEDPEKMIDQCLRNLNDDLGKVKSETATIMAEEQRAKREVDECNADIAKMQNYAIKALEANNEGDAKRFLEEKARLSGKLAGLTEAYNAAQANAAHMRDMHDKLVADIQELENRKETIKAKLAVAKTQERLNKLGDSVTSANSTIASFEKYEALANKKLDEANAMAQLNKGAEDSIRDLTAKYASSSNSAIDDELAALKASLGK